MNSVVLNRTRQAPAEDTPAFGGIAERFRRAGDLNRAIALCREGLQRYPDLISARVTLGWALLDSGQAALAGDEFAFVLQRAPDNLAALRGMAEAHDRRAHETQGDGFGLSPTADRGIAIGAIGHERLEVRSPGVLVQEDERCAVASVPSSAKSALPALERFLRQVQSHRLALDSRSVA